VQKVRDAERERQYDEYKDASAKSSRHGQARRIRFGCRRLRRAEGVVRRDEMIRANLSAMATHPRLYL